MGRPDFRERLKSCLEARTPELSTTHARKGEYIYTHGDRATHLYVVARGVVKTEMVTAAGKRGVIDIHTVGDLIGDLCLAQGQRQEAAVALTPAELRLVPGPTFSQILFQNGLHAEYAGHLATRIFQQQRRILRFVTDNSERRLGAILLDIARKFGWRQGGHLHIGCRLTQDDLAEMVGTTRSRIGFFLKEFRRLGLVRLARGRTMIVDDAALSLYLEDGGTQARTEPAGATV
jgi:CRP/FNR family cyclic AMP-dependent transcriptional regulator